MEALTSASRRRVAGLLRRLVSHVEADRTLAVEALRKLGDPFHTAINEIEKPSANGSDGSLSEAEMKKIFDAGFAAGVKHADNVNHGSNDFRSLEPTWAGVAQFCLQHIEKLPAQHHEFIRDMAGRVEWRAPTERQAKYLKSLFFGLGGKPSQVPA
ncbi:MAG TPA: hypothetical protein VKP67_00920 [Xanthobacteraceae bacterium]|nr:hypothetical protein [Xanthobacteraceae bacterium]